jgi:putative spermidine/putrescine transport system permease protein
LKKTLWILLATLFYLPFAYLVLLSLATNWRYPLLLPEGFNLETWQYIIQTDSAVGSSFVLSVLLSASVAFLATFFGFFIGKTIATHRLKNIFLTITYFPYAFSPVIYAFCLNFLFMQLNLVGNMEGVVLAQFIITFPFAIILFSNHWSNELLNLESVVLTLGGSPRQAFWRVILPLSKNILLICFFQTFMISWFEYGLTSVIGLGKVQTLTLKTYQFIGESNVYFAALASCLLVFPPLILLWFNRRFVFKEH